MTRAALLPMPGDPFILNHFLANFKNVWAEEVDMLYICLNVDHRMPKAVRDYAIARVSREPKVKFIVVDEMLFQGKALQRLLEIVEEELIFSIEDDTVVIKKGQVDKCFRKIETGEADVIGSPRFSCSAEILEASAKKYNLDYSGYGDKGPNLWPCFFFARKEDLMRTDLHFGPTGWQEGDYIKELDIRATGTISADVFVWLSMQLRAMGLRIGEVQQYHSHPDDLVDMAMGLNLGDPNCFWIHIGSLTMTAEDLLMAIGDPKDSVNFPKTEMEKKELERRFAWLKVFLEEKDNQDPDLSQIRWGYEARISEYIRAFSLSNLNIDNLMKVYRKFVAW